MVKHKYLKGARAERELVALLSSLGYVAFRLPRSGGRTSPLPDVIGIKKGYTFFFECKNFSNFPISLKKVQIENLLKISEVAGAKPFIALKTERGFLFLNPKEINSLRITEKEIVEKAVGIEYFKLF